MRRPGVRRRRLRAPVAALVVATAVAAMTLAGCSSSSSSGAQGSPSPSASSPTEPTRLPKETLTFGVFGNADEVAAYEQMTPYFAPLSRDVTVKVESWPDRDAMIDDLRDGARVPDVFVASQRDLLWLEQRRLIQPVDGLLDDRGVDFGDDYPRDAITAFADPTNSHLMCLPYGIDPTVVFYNTKLLKLGRMHTDPPQPGQGWSLQQFGRAAQWAVRHHPGVKGLYVDPTLEGLAPFLLSGGADLFDQSDQPTSLQLSSDDSQAALTQTLSIAGRKDLTLSSKQLLRKTPLEWFEDGKLAMLEGDRRLVPLLRQKLGFTFDVMPMPTLNQPATVSGMTGLCVSRHATDAGTAADFVVYASSRDALDIVADAGYLQPANQSVALTDAFLQPGRLPRHSSVFTFALKSSVTLPSLTQWDQLDDQVDPLVADLFHATPARILTLSRRIDRTSLRILAPAGASASPSS